MINKTAVDLTHLQFNNKKYSQNSYGCYLKSYETISGKQRYYKMSNYDSYRLVFGFESINEYIVSRVLDCLEIEHLNYELLYANVKVDNNIFNTYLCASYEYKKKNERKIAFDNYYEVNRKKNESQIDFIKRIGFEDYLYNMLFVDYIIFNRDRHGSNIEVLMDNKNNIRLSPLFDQGMSLLLSDYENEEYVKSYDILRSEPVNNFFGTRSTRENLKFIDNKGLIKKYELTEKDFKYIFGDLKSIVPKYTIEKLKAFLIERLKVWKSLL